MLIPTVQDDNKFFDINSRLLKDRIINFHGPVDERVAEIIVAELLYLQSEDPKKPISMYINSPGGSVTDGLAILDTMNLITCPVYTYCVGQCASMGAVLLAAGEKDHRYALPNSRVMVHMVSSGAGGQILDIKKQVEEADRLNDRLFELLAKYTGKDIKSLKKDCDRDKFMSAEEAVKYGLVDKVLGK